MARPKRGREDPAKPVTLKELAEHVGLSPTTVSVVLNRAPVADSIPQRTQELVFAAAEELRYRPNHLARSLRSRRTHTLGVLVPELAEPYAAGVMSGLDSHVLEAGYFSLVASHQGQPYLIEEYVELLENRRVEGLILLATALERAPGLPTVVVSGHTRLEGVTNVVLDHDRAARLALAHLAELGHRRIALFKGHPRSADTDYRWQSIVATAGELGLEIDDRLVFQLEEDPSGHSSRTEETYRAGYQHGRELLARGRPFTALFAFNDVSAIGAMRAFFDAGKRVPRDISVVGFDDILSAGFHNPGLTTVHQPLREMGETAVRILLDRLHHGTSYPDFVTVEPTLVIRESTGPVAAERPDAAEAPVETAALRAL
jgi:LacI family transcriptional regulator